MSLLFSDITALTMEEDAPLREHAFVAVEGSRIVSVTAKRPVMQFDRVIDGSGKVLMPGLINAHTHVPMTLFRGYGGGHDLQTWLSDYIFPAEDRLTPEAVRAGTGIALAEQIAAGVTCFADMYYFCDDIIEMTLTAGLSANIARGVTCFEPADNPANLPACRELAALTERWHGCGDGQILIDGCIHGEYTSFLAPRLWDYMADFTQSHDLGLHVHLSETRSEQEACLARHGKTPAQVFDSHGLWDVRSIAAHCVWVTEEDMTLLAEKGVTAVHCPASNLKLGSGVAPVTALRRAGVNLALGTDGCSSNNSHDMIEDMKLAALLACGTAHDPLALSALDVLKMATVNGAKALGRNTGVIAPGKTADLILLDFTRPNLVPCHDVMENIVYAAHGGDVLMNMARGQIIYEKGEFFTLDTDRLRYAAEKAVPGLVG